MTTQVPKFTVTHPIVDNSTTEPMEVETWSNESENSDDDMIIQKEPLHNPIYQVSHQPVVIRNPRTGRYISTTSRAYNELTRGVYQTPTEKRHNTVTLPQKQQDTPKAQSKMDDLWAKHGF